jgi:O-antigen/teichoic acid export membrane protein
MGDDNIGSRLAALKTRVKERLGPLWWYSAVMFGVQRLGDFINIYIGLWLVPQWVSRTELGALLPLTQIGAVLGLPLAVILGSFGKFVNTFAAKGELGKVKALLQDVLAVTAIASVAIAGYTYLAAPFVFERMRVGGHGLVWILCGLAIAGAISPVFTNALQAMQRFRIMAVGGLIAAPVRLVALLLLLPACGIVGFFGAQLLMALVAIGIAVWGLWQELSPAIPRESYRQHFREIGFYMLPMLALTVAGTLQSTTELFVIRHRLPDLDSAAYYMVSRFAEIPCGIWGALIIPFFPLVSERHEQGRDTSRILATSVVFSLALGGLLALFLTWGADWLLGLRADWGAYRSYGWLMGLLTLRSALLIPAGLLTLHETACRRFGFGWVVGGLQLLEAGLLYGLTGIGFFQPYLPPSWLQWLSALDACRLEFVVGVMLMFAVATIFYLLVYLRLRIRGQNLLRPDGAPENRIPVA